MKAWKAIGRFRGDSSFSTWLYRIAVNACLNHRAARRPPAQSFRRAFPIRTGARRRASCATTRRVRVRDAVSRLPEKQRATLILKVYHELTHEDVAQILGSRWAP